MTEKIASMPSAADAQSISPDSPRRRSLLGWMTAVFGLIASAAAGLPIIGYFLGALRAPRVEWVNLGPVAKFPPRETRFETFDNPLRKPWDGITSNTGVYVRYLGADERQQQQFLVFAINCTHLGCPVSWFPQSGLFMCPCHGGVYYENGERASGPPPRGLYHCVWRVRRDQLEIQAPHLPTLQDTLRQSALKHQAPIDSVNVVAAPPGCSSERRKERA